MLQVSAQVLEVYEGATLSDNMIMYQYFLLSLMGRETAQVIFFITDNYINKQIDKLLLTHHFFWLK